MDTFSFVDLFAFLQTIIGMILAYMAGKRSERRNEKSRPRSKDCGSNASTD